MPGEKKCQNWTFPSMSLSALKASVPMEGHLCTQVLVRPHSNLKWSNDTGSQRRGRSGLYALFSRGHLESDESCLPPSPISSVDFEVQCLTGTAVEHTGGPHHPISHRLLNHKRSRPTLGCHPDGLCDKASADGWPRPAREVIPKSWLSKRQSREAVSRRQASPHASIQLTDRRPSAEGQPR